MHDAGNMMPSLPSSVLFMGSKQLGLRILQEMHESSANSLMGVLTLDDTADSRSVYAQFNDYCCKNKIPIFTASSRKNYEQIIHELRPDLCIVVGWYWLISSELLDSTPFGFIGIHNSLLPRYRGGAPLVWQLINNESRVGFSVFSFTPGMDDGPIWAQGSVIVEGTDYVSDVLYKLERETLLVFRSVYPNILNGLAKPTAQECGSETYCAQRIPEDGMINWQLTASEIYNFIRAQSDPYPGAFTWINQKKLKVWRANVFDKPYFGSKGQVARISQEGVYVICGQNTALLLLEVEIDSVRGKANDLIRSIKIRLGNSSVLENNNGVNC